LHISETTQPNFTIFLWMLTITVAKSSSGSL